MVWTRSQAWWRNLCLWFPQKKSLTETVLNEDHQNDSLIKLERNLAYHFSRLREEQLTEADRNSLWS